MAQPPSIIVVFIGTSVIISAILLRPTDSEVHLVSKDQVYRMEQGSNVTLGCEFIASRFNLFDNPILWRKFQLNEETQMNMMGNVLEPFRSLKRFKVSFSSTSTKHRFNLTIAGVTFEDVGNYTCEVNGPQNTLLGSVTYVIYVKAPLQSITINSIDDSQLFINNERHHDVSSNASFHAQSIFKPRSRRLNASQTDLHSLLKSSSSAYISVETTQRRTTPFASNDLFKTPSSTKSHLLSDDEFLNFDSDIPERTTVLHHNKEVIHSRQDAKKQSTAHLLPDYSDYKPPSSTTREVNYSENAPGRFSCIASGLYPPFSLSVLVGSRNITNSLNHRLKVHSSKGIKGLRLIHFEVARWTDKLWASPDDDGKVIQCNAAFISSPIISNSTLLKIVVNYAPKVSCSTTSVLLNQVEVVLSCRIKSQPGVVSINWFSPRSVSSSSSANSSTIQQTMESNEYRLQNRIDGVLIETSLIIMRVQEKNFGLYNVTAENGLDLGWGTVELRRKEVHQSARNWVFVEPSSNLKRGIGSPYHQRSSLQSGSPSKYVLPTLRNIALIFCVYVPFTVIS